MAILKNIRQHSLPHILPLLLLLTLPGAFGCSSRVSTEDIRTELAYGSYETLTEKMQAAHEAHEEFVTALNLARVLQLQGRWQESIEIYEAGLTLLEEYERRAIINMRELLGEAGSILISRGSLGYYGTGYERTLLHTFNAMNYVMLGDFSGAAVEMRRMEQRQEVWLAEEEYRLREYAEKRQSIGNPASYDDEPESLPGQYSMAELLRDPQVRALANSYQDPFSYSLSAIVCRLAGDEEYAGVSLRRAALLDPAAGDMFSAAWGPGKGVARQRANQTQGLPSYDNWTPNIPRRAKKASAATQEVTVMIFSGLAPALNLEQIRIPAPYIGYLMIDLPSYIGSVRGNAPTVELLAPGKSASAASPRSSAASAKHLAAHPLLRIELLAYRTLRDEVRYEIGSAIARAIFRAATAGAAYAVARSNDDTQAFAGLIGLGVSAIMDLVASGTSSSVRNWELLPAAGFLSMGAVPRGSCLRVTLGADEAEIDLPGEAEGIIVMISQITTSKMRVDYVAY
ncbi:MAG: hypothetical protein LBV80_09085 [Deltaproteobacteria bacterium]|jgi:hypothetical protein|nr:hypothetical protein [Deltaproteobacteria bacterium]